MNETNENTQRRARERTVLRTTLLLLGLGTAYYVWVRVTGFGIPCPIRAATGYLCPGCGMTHAVVALLAGDPAEAFRQNTLSLTVIPVLLVYGVWRAARYIRDGRSDFAIWEVALLMVLAMAVAAYGITRNLGRTPDPSILQLLPRIITHR